MSRILAILIFSCVILFSQGSATAQKKVSDKAAKKGETTETKGKKSESKKKVGDNSGKKEAPPKSEDPVVGKTKEGKEVYEGARGGFYYLTETGNKSYVKDFVGAKVVGKTPDGFPIYEGPRGGRFYYSASGEKIYVKK